MTKFFVLAASAALIGIPAAAAPGDTSSAQGAATAEVVAPITLEHVNGAALNFGTFTTGDAGGTIVVDQTGVGTSTGEVTLMGGSVEAADAFTVAGDPNRAFTIATAGGSVTNGTDTMNFTTSAATSGALDAAGESEFSVGGTLSVAGGESAGNYAGSYNVTVAYN
ncbi:MAG: DUF4402 domain-containing protein [Erythrobacter sp.]|nr:DUF4402 domain-containing protein [Erythrobacter sp.]NCQ22724.1 DUF4402 domain-containing protein [Sphingomonadales bacterium]